MLHAVHGVAESQTRLSDFTFTFHFHALEKEMAELFDVYTLRDDWYVEKMLEEERVCAGCF